MAKRLTLGVALVVLTVGAAVAVVRLRGEGLAPSPIPPPGEGTPAPGRAASAVAERFLGVVVTGEAVDVASRVDGRVERVQVRLGDHVRRGELLVALDPQPLRHELAIGEAGLASAQGEEQRAVLELADARARLERRRSATTKEGVSVISGEELLGAEHQARLAEQRLAVARAQAAERRGRLEQLRLQVADTEIRAPFDGELVVRYVAAGAQIARGTAIARLLADDPPRLRFAVPEEHAQTVRVGMEIRADLDLVAGQVGGVVERLAPEIDAASRMVFAEARLEVPTAQRPRLLSGLVARVTVIPGAAPAAP